MAPHPARPRLHRREGTEEPEGKPCWKNRALHHRPGIAAQLLIIGNASLARREGMLRPDANILSSDFHPREIFVRPSAAVPGAGGGGQADKWVESGEGRDLLASNTRPKLSAL